MDLRGWGLDVSNRVGIGVIQTTCRPVADHPTALVTSSAIMNTPGPD